MRNIFLFFLMFTIYSCTLSSKKDEYEYISLSKFKNDSSLIKNETPVKLLAFSGSKANDKDNVYYSQVIVVNQETGDTIDILTPLLKIPDSEGKDGKIYIPVMEFNPNKKVFNAIYERKSDTSLNFLLQVMGGESGEVGEDLSKYNKMIKPELVALNNSLPIFKNNYKTVIGILTFDQDPR